jgi:hypothetical protein
LTKNSRVVLKLRVPNQLHLKGQNTAIHRVIMGEHVFGASATLNLLSVQSGLGPKYWYRTVVAYDSLGPISYLAL